jgi:tripartite motif-containing protein 9/67
MDLELRCPSCKEYYRSPVYLPCTHSLCYTCALTSIQTTTEHQQNQSTFDISSTSFASDLDKLSLTSDNDSGVIINRHSPSSSSSSSSSSSISSSSRPSSLLLPPALPEISSSSTSFLTATPTRHQTNKTYSTCLQCPVCSKIIFMDITGIKSLPKNRLLADIINRYHGEKSSEQQQAPKCQLCRPSEERIITRICEQCRIGYCDQCREQYHPMRGPYSKHNFLDALQQYSNNSNEKIFCHEHSNRLATAYCLHCRLECCQQCSIHSNHDIVSIQQASKLYKVN